MVRDAQLLARWRAGDTAAGGELIERHAPRLQRFFAACVHSAVEDLCQQTLTECVRSLARIEDDGEARSFRGFLFTVARRRLLNHFRDRTRAEQRFDPLEHSVADVGEGPSTLLRIDENRRKVVDAMRRLALDLQIAVQLHYWEELTAAEIAGVLEIPVGTVKSRLLRAKKALRDALGTSEDDTETAARSLATE
jgi:RNA polymerase sigma-70 factor (ECF subfamily)